MTTEDRPSCTVAAGRQEDAPEIHRLVGLLAESLSDSDRYRSSPASIGRHGFGPHRFFHSFLAWPGSGGRPVGTCLFLPDYSTWRAGPGVHILDLVVEAAWRGRGVGLELMTAAAVYGRDHWGADYLILSVDRANAGAIRFYHGNGFVSDDHNRVMVRHGLDDLSITM